MSPLALALAALLAPAPLGVPQDSPAVDSNAIRWHLPGTFEEARSRAADEERILLVKGVSFGIDAAGAACATKGMW